MALVRVLEKRMETLRWISVELDAEAARGQPPPEFSRLLVECRVGGTEAICPQLAFGCL